MARLSKPPGWAGRYHHNDQSDNADQTEWQAVLHGSSHVSAGTVDDEMSEAADQDVLPVGHVEDRLQDKEVVRESTQGPVAEIIADRANLLGDAYPFQIDGNSLIYRRPQRPLYELLLGITQAPSLTTGAYVQLPRVFEHLSTLAAKGFLGPAAGGMRTGWPRPTGASHFQALVMQVKAAAAPGTNDAEWSWAPELGLPENPVPALVKEEGLDLVVWQTWNDMRGSPLYLFGQCACGSNWMTKGADIDLKMLGRWFRLPSVDPVRSLFVPHYVVPSLMREMSQKSGLVFDRVRIVQALQAEHLTVELDAIANDVASALAVAQGMAPVTSATAKRNRSSSRRSATPKQQP